MTRVPNLIPRSTDQAELTRILREVQSQLETLHGAHADLKKAVASAGIVGSSLTQGSRLTSDTAGVDYFPMAPDTLTMAVSTTQPA